MPASGWAQSTPGPRRRAHVALTSPSSFQQWCVAACWCYCSLPLPSVTDQPCLTAACECRTRRVASPRQLPGVYAAIGILILTALYDEGNGFCSAQQNAPDRRCEVVVVDGGSKDRTVCIAEKMGAKVRMIWLLLADTQDLSKELRDLHCLTCNTAGVVFQTR